MTTEENQPSLEDVLSHAIETGDVSGTLDGDAAGPASDEGDLADDLGEGAEGGDKEADGDAEQDAEGGEPDKAKGEQLDEHGRVRDPATGKFKKPEEKPAGEVEAKKPGEKPATDVKTGEPKKPDALNDPIPKDLKKDTQDRIRTLIDTNKETAAQRDKVAQDFDYMIEGIKATGTTPEQYGELLQFMAAFNSKDPATQEKALEMIENVADRLATLLGKERTPSDILANHKDLQEAVAKGQVTPQYAKEIARTRNGQAFRTEIETSQNQRQTQEQAQQQELAGGRQSLNELEQSLKATDPQYDAKRAALVPILQPLFKTIPPSQWRTHFEQAYKNLRMPAAAAPARKPIGRQPMRAGGSAQASGKGGDLKTGAGSMLDAVNEALSEMNR
jgi:hypothetical protein